MNTVADKIVPLNISEIDRELHQIDGEVDRLHKRREELLLIRRYATQQSPTATPVATPNIDRGITRFLLLELKNNGRLDNKELIEAYANATNKTYEEVANNVRFTLSNSKKKGWIEGALKEPGAKKKGTIYTITEKGLEYVQTL